MYHAHLGANYCMDFIAVTLVHNKYFDKELRND